MRIYINIYKYGRFLYPLILKGRYKNAQFYRISSHYSSNYHHL